MPIPTMTKNEAMFLDQYTRKLMVEFCKSQMTHEDPFKGVPGWMSREKAEQIFVDYAVSKKWLSVKEPRRVLAAGWATAARFLKR